MIENKEALMFVKDMYLKKFKTLDTFEKNYNIYKNIIRITFYDLLSMYVDKYFLVESTKLDLLIAQLI